MYTPHVGRWLSKDPAGYVDGPNQYLYVTNNPINMTDPSGLERDDCKPGEVSAPRPGYVPGLPNDCTQIFKKLKNLVGLDDPNCPKGGADFKKVCNEHDNCYNVCTFTKEKCDATFNRDLIKACEAAGKDASLRCKGWMGVDACKKVAGTDYTGWLPNKVVKKHYSDLQKKACVCEVPPKPAPPKPAPPTPAPPTGPGGRGHCPCR